MNSPPEIIFLDMEGTVFLKDLDLDDGRVAPSAWTVLAARLGPQCLAEENASKDRWLANGYGSYLDWMRDTVDIHVRHGLTEHVFLDVVRRVEYTPGVHNAVQTFQGWGARIVLITGGFKAIADRAQVDLRIDHVFAGCEYFFDFQTGLVKHYNLLPADEVGKADFMRLMCREYNVPASRCVFVGDGKNDVHLARCVGFSVAFNAQSELGAVASVSIEQAPDDVDFGAVVRAIEAGFSPEVS